MGAAIGEITDIDTKYLDGNNLDRISIAERMSWASRRETSRLEDTAYCLLGIFNVNMPLLYGEGEKAFIRLQEEIMKRSDDRSLFVWADDAKKGDWWLDVRNCLNWTRTYRSEKKTESGLLAPSPKCFKFRVKAGYASITMGMGPDYI